MRTCEIRTSVRTTRELSVNNQPDPPDEQDFKVCDNVGDHLIGNVYARYEWESEAQAAVDNLNDRWYAGMFRTAGVRST